MGQTQQQLTFQNAHAELFRFEGVGKVSEYHVMIHVDNPLLTFAEQLQAVEDAYDQLCSSELKGADAVFKRYFVSDAANQTDDICALAIEGANCALSIIQQPPLDGTKVALWAYLQTDIFTHALESGLYESRHGQFRHLWHGSAHLPAESSQDQTTLLLNQYILQLMNEECTLADNCIRTWFFVNDIDNRYAGMVKARNEVFYTQGLTDKTHFIASTGIGGRQADHRIFVQMDAYAVAGLQKGQVHYLYAADHLNRTSEYGVSFERGTCVDYGDRRQVFISGTASIDNHGKILFSTDVRKQTLRMWENVEALLKEADCTFDDIGQMIVYLRDIADYAAVRKLYDERFPGKPVVFVNAPVCRPGWLIEMECMGVKELKNDAFPLY